MTPKTLLAAFVLLSTSIFLGFNAAGSGSDDVRIAVLSSHGIDPYQEVLQGFKRCMAQSGIPIKYDVYPLEGDAGKAGRVAEQVAKDGARMLLTLGSLATQTACKTVAHIPIVGGMILNSDDLKGTANATGVVLEFPPEIQFEWLRRILPDNKDIGVIYNPSENGRKLEQAARMAEQMGLRLHAEQIQSPRDLPGALENLAKKANVLWGVADRIALTPQTAEHILLFSYRNRIPFVGLSASWVKAGALYSLDWDYADLGAQCAGIAREILNGAEARSIPPVSPRKVLYTVNLKTAVHMKIEIPENLVRGAREVF